MSGRMCSEAEALSLNTAESVTLRIALASDEQLETWLREGHGGFDFRFAILEQLEARKVCVRPLDVRRFL